MRKEELLETWGWSVALGQHEDLLTMADKYLQCKEQGHRLGDILCDLDVVTEQEIEDAIKTSPDDVLLGNHLINVYAENVPLKNAMVEAMARTERYFLPYLKSLSHVSIRLAQFTYDSEGMKECERLTMVVVRVVGSKVITKAEWEELDESKFPAVLVFGGVDAFDNFKERSRQEEAKSRLNEKLGGKLYYAITSKDVISHHLSGNTSGGDADVNARVFNLNKLSKGNESEVAVSAILGKCIEMGGTDVSIVPLIGRDEVRVRIRLNTDLEDFPSMPILNREQYRGVFNVLKNGSGATENDGPVRVPVDGQAVTVVSSNSKYNHRLRLNFFPNGVEQDPGNEGVNIKLRFIPQKMDEVDINSDVSPFKKLGFVNQSVVQFLKECCSTPSGITLMFGPMGSGKTTTLYAMIKEYRLQYPNKSICSIEDPIENIIPGVEQIQATAKAIEDDWTSTDYIAAMKRQDMQAMLVGDIRDAGTAILCGQAAASGLRIFGTMHAVNTVEGLEVYLGNFEENERRLIVSNISHVVSQRMIKLACEHCSVETVVNEVLVKTVNRWLDLNTDIVLTEEDFKESSVLTQKNSGKCGHCKNSGMTPVLETLRLKNADKKRIKNGEFEFLYKKRDSDLVRETLKLVVAGKAPVEALKL